jgi:cytidine deaminase
MIIDWNKLISAARDVREHAYAPFSKFRVGAAILTADGAIFAGCNVENSSYGLTICAERAAVLNAISRGSRDFVAIAVFSESIPPARPCGACRQVLYEFNPEMEIACASPAGAIDKFRLLDIFPEGFCLS